MSVLGIVNAFRRAKDMILLAGPDGLRQFADGIHSFEEGCRRTADYIEKIGPYIQFQETGGGEGAPAAPKDVPQLSPQVRYELQQAKDLMKEVEGAIQGPLSAPRSPTPPDEQKGLIDWIKNIDPEVKKAILNIILSLLTKVVAANPGA